MTTKLPFEELLKNMEDMARRMEEMGERLDNLPNQAADIQRIRFTGRKYFWYFLKRAFEIAWKQETVIRMIPKRSA